MSQSHDERRAWSDERRLGDRVAVFAAGETVRCPATRRLSHGADVVCGHGHDQVGTGTRVTVIADRRALNRSSGTLNRTCDSCRTRLHIEVECLALVAVRAA